MEAYWALLNKSIKTSNYNEIVKIDCLNLEKSVSVGVIKLRYKIAKMQFHNDRTVTY